MGPTLRPGVGRSGAGFPPPSASPEPSVPSIGETVGLEQRAHLLVTDAPRGCQLRHDDALLRAESLVERLQRSFEAIDPPHDRAPA